MKSSNHIVRRPYLILTSLWTAGLALIWWAVPTGPRDGWQPPAGEQIVGLLNDGQIVMIMTCPRVPERQATRKSALRGSDSPLGYRERTRARQLFQRRRCI